MSRSFLRQSTQVSASFDFDDALSAGVSLQSASYTLESDLNSLRSQVRRLMHSTGSGKWYDDIAPTPVYGRRGVDQLGYDLENLERQRFVFRTQKNTVGLVVPAAQNYVTLSVGSGFAPGFVAAVSPHMTGTVVASLSGSQFDVFSMVLQSGSNQLVPKNLVVVVSASSGNPIQAASNGFDIYGLMQVSSSVADGDTFDDTTKRIQISFVVADPTRTFLTAALASDIAGKTIQYSYARRIPLDAIPDDAYFDTVFVDMVADLSSALAAVQASSDLNSAIDNQTGAATQTDRNIEVRMTSPFSWSFTDSAGTRHFFEVNAASQTAFFDVNDFRVVNTNAAQFTGDVRTSVSGNWVQVGQGNVGASGTLTLAAGTGSNLVLSGGGGVTVTDQWKPSSTYSNTFYVASGTTDWNNYVTDFGQVSLFTALHHLSQSITGTKGQMLRTAVASTSIAPDTNITYPTNLDAPLLDYSAYSATQFVSGVNVYVNGQLQRNGVDLSANHDVYPGTSTSTGDLKFTFKIFKDDVITMVIVN